MQYTLARYRRLCPEPPFLLGGRYCRLGERAFLVDAVERVEFIGPQPSQLKDGDQIVLHVERKTDALFHCAHVEFIARGENGSPKAVTTARFARFVAVVRGFFQARGLSEIFTPSLVPCPGLEPSLEPFAVTVKRGRETRTAYLPTSPEIHLKKALTNGWTDIFEIRPCFRAGEFSPHHENEFFMLEWYRAFADLSLIQQDLQALLNELGQQGFAEGAVGESVGVITFKELFATVFNGFVLTPQTTREELLGLCQSLGLDWLPSDSFNDLFHRLLIERIEAHLVKMGPVIVRDFPPSQAALARLTPEGWGDRFEFYWQGFEIANAFNEVFDADEMARRWQAEQRERQHLGTSALPQDPELLRLMREKGMPPTAGVALGVERLFMACTGISDIRELRLFATTDLFNE